MKGLFRALGFLAFVAAFVVLVIDGATMISARQMDFTSLGQVVQSVARPGLVDRLGEAVGRSVHPLLWAVIETVVFAPPAVLVLGLVGLGLLRLGRAAEPEVVLRLRDGRGT